MAFASLPLADRPSPAQKQPEYAKTGTYRYLAYRHDAPGWYGIVRSIVLCERLCMSTLLNSDPALERAPLCTRLPTPTSTQYPTATIARYLYPGYQYERYSTMQCLHNNTLPAFNPIHANAQRSFRRSFEGPPPLMNTLLVLPVLPRSTKSCTGLFAAA